MRRFCTNIIYKTTNQFCFRINGKNDFETFIEAKIRTFNEEYRKMYFYKKLSIENCISIEN